MRHRKQNPQMKRMINFFIKIQNIFEVNDIINFIEKQQAKINI